LVSGDRGSWGGCGHVLIGVSAPATHDLTPAAASSQLSSAIRHSSVDSHKSAIDRGVKSAAVPTRTARAAMEGARSCIGVVDACVPVAAIDSRPTAVGSREAPIGALALRDCIRTIRIAVHAARVFDRGVRDCVQGALSNVYAANIDEPAVEIPVVRCGANLTRTRRPATTLRFFFVRLVFHVLRLAVRVLGLAVRVLRLVFHVWGSAPSSRGSAIEARGKATASPGTNFNRRDDQGVPAAQLSLRSGSATVAPARRSSSAARQREAAASSFHSAVQAHVLGDRILRLAD
jgi:hypothetical protein